MMKVKIGNIYVGDGCPVFIVAELSGNHGGSLDKALEIVRSAKRAGANAIKLQTYTADSITLNCDRQDFLLPGDSPWSKYKTFWDLYNEAKTPMEWHKPIFDEAKKLRLLAFSSPFDSASVDFLQSLDVPAYKIASPEIVDIPLLKKVAACGKPVIISKGVANHEDISLALQTLRMSGASDIILLQCNSSYPAPLSESNLKVISDIPKRFGVLSGLSDHTEGDLASIVATALGGAIIEKHICLEDSAEAVDSFFSMKEAQFAEMVRKIRAVEDLMGVISYEISESARSSLVGRRSLYISKRVQAGELISEHNIKSVRPSHGLHPKYFHEIVGKAFSVEAEIGDRLDWNMIKKK